MRVKEEWSESERRVRVKEERSEVTEYYSVRVEEWWSKSRVREELELRSRVSCGSEYVEGSPDSSLLQYNSAN